MTAIAAVIALSSASAFAQTADVPADPTATPIVDVTPAPVATDTLAPAVATAAEPVATKTTATTARKATATKTTAARSRPAPVHSTATAAAPTAVIAAANAPMTAVEPLPIAPVAAPPVATAPVAQAPATASSIDVLPTAELGGLGLLILGGGAFAFRSRRRRRAEEAQDAEWQANADAQAAADAELAMVAEPEPAPMEPAIAAPVLAEASAPSGTEFIAPQTDLPEAFDIARFGPNVQDAYRGPTEDNPSLSLKTRLRRANGMDQQERKLADEVEAVTGEPILDETDTAQSTDAANAKPAVVDQATSDLIFAHGNDKPSPALTH
ncbi:hypothetical protein [Sphingomonas sp.]|uniref:hypothetical protein n=1 Tax=Sphingomonas sp. TaxID=28214 RepID=UPI00286D57F4|nr:hypothetical protein [Sphingomonas sp.]